MTTNQPENRTTAQDSNSIPGDEDSLMKSQMVIAFTGLLGIALHQWRKRKARLINLSTSGA